MKILTVITDIIFSGLPTVAIPCCKLIKASVICWLIPRKKDDPTEPSLTIA